jgi:hypothetical protein
MHICNSILIYPQSYRTKESERDSLENEMASIKSELKKTLFLLDEKTVDPKSPISNSTDFNKDEKLMNEKIDLLENSIKSLEDKLIEEKKLKMKFSDDLNTENVKYQDLQKIFKELEVIYKQQLKDSSGKGRGSSAPSSPLGGKFPCFFEHKLPCIFNMCIFHL